MLSLRKQLKVPVSQWPGGHGPCSSMAGSRCGGQAQDSLCQDAALDVAGAFPPEHPGQPLPLVGVQADLELPRGRLRLAQALPVLDALQDSL